MLHFRGRCRTKPVDAYYSFVNCARCAQAQPCMLEEAEIRRRVSGTLAQMEIQDVGHIREP